MKTLNRIICVAAFAVAASLVNAADTYNISGNPFTFIDSTKGDTNSTSLATNGVYTTAIGAAGASFTGTETNLVAINKNITGNYVVLSLQGQALAATGATNAQFVITSSPRGVNVAITNAASSGWGGATQPRSIFGTFTLPLNGTTLVSTNIVLSPNSTPAYNSSLVLYCEQITVNMTNNFLTNYLARVQQN